ncbi:MAG: hypothetical protein JWQ98_497 [Chlorobi bacterium]|nr:hypothetical protein [Chlorobiota bacterium]
MKQGPAYLLALLLLPAATLICRAQTDTSARPPAPVDTAKKVAAPRPSGYVMTRSPTTAVLLSIVPGGGQYYNQQYWKVPLFAVSAGYFLFQAIRYNSLFVAKANEADQAGQSSTLYPALKFQRESYRDNRDANFAYFLGVEALGMIDAYVGAHLFDFNVDDDISSHIYLDPGGRSIGLNIRF